MGKGCLSPSVEFTLIQQEHHKTLGGRCPLQFMNAFFALFICLLLEQGNEQNAVGKTDDGGPESIWGAGKTGQRKEHVGWVLKHNKKVRDVPGKGNRMCKCKEAQKNTR